MFDGAILAPEWQKLVLQQMDRFIFALDNVWARHWEEFYLDQMKYWRIVMTGLPTDVAHKWAHGNAERLWKISPKTD